MVNLTELVAQLRGQGSDCHDIEAKSAAGGLPKSTRETLSAFSNGSGGVLVLGLDEAAGFTVPEKFDAVQVRDALARMCADDLEPPLRPRIDIVPFEQRHVVVAVLPEIDPATKPCFVKERGEFAGSFIRGGDGDRKLTEYEVRLLHSNRGQPLFDREPVVEAGLGDLDSEAVAALLRRVRRRQPRAFGPVPDEVVLRRLGALIKSEERLVPTLAGLLTLGTYPQEFFPQLNATFVAIPAESKDCLPASGPRFLDNRTFNGSIPVIVEDAIDAIARNLRVESAVSGAGRVDTLEYPLEALREAIVNALMHRDYSPTARGTQVQIELYTNRLVVRNPGGLFGPVTPDDLGTEGVSSSRNARLATLLQEVPLPESDRVVCENRGTGIPTMLEQLRRSGTASVRFDSRITRFTTIFDRSVQPTVVQSDNLSESEAAILALFRPGITLRASEIAEATGLGRAMVSRHLHRLIESGRIVPTAPPKSRKRAYRAASPRL